MPLSFLPRHFGTAAILRSNRRFPFLEHVACLRCLKDPSSPSAVMEATNAALAARLDPQGSAIVAAWASGLDRRIERLSSSIERAIGDSLTDVGHAFTVKEMEQHRRSVRHHAAALGF